MDEALQVLGTDRTGHVDFLMFNRHKAHAVKDPTIPETLEKYKKQGKVRFGGGLTTPGDIKATVGAGIRNPCGRDRQCLWLAILGELGVT
jgi:hypothetical protein